MTKQDTVGDVMTRDLKSIPASASVRVAAEEMTRSGIGSIVIEKEGTICGIVTDRDIVVRCVAQGGNCNETPVGAICSADLAILSPGDALDSAVWLMRKKAIRRIPVVERGRTVGILSLGDLALARDPDSALGAISRAAPNS